MSRSGRNPSGRMRSERVQCLVIGDAMHPEMREPIRWLNSHDDISLTISKSSDSAFWDSNQPLDLIVLARTYPGQIGQATVDAMQRIWPLAMMISLNGSWCEGEGRSGRPEPGVWRFSACSFVTRIGERLRKKSSMFQVMRQLPRLATEAERLLAESDSPLPEATGSVLIATPNHEAYEALSDALAVVGWSSVWHSRPDLPIPERISAAIWDAARGDEQDWNAVLPFSASVQPAPVCMLLGFPRSQDFRRAGEVSQQAERSGCKISILPKPVRLAELCNELASLARKVAARR